VKLLIIISNPGASGMDHLFFQSVYCLSGLRIVGKNRGSPKHVNSRKVAALIRTHC